MKNKSKLSPSRRDFLEHSAIFPALPLLAKLARGQNGAPANTMPPAAFLQLTLAKTFPNAYVLAVSPDGLKMCLYFTRHPENKFTWTQGLWKQGTTAQRASEALEIISAGSWKPVYSIPHRQQPAFVSFFADSERLYAEMSAFLESGQLLTQQLVVDLQKKKIQRYLRQEHPQERGLAYFALTDKSLLGVQINGQSRRTEALILAALPDYKEIKRVPIDHRLQHDRFPFDTGPAISDDRKILLHTIGHLLVCRRTEDLGVIWTRQIQPADFFGVWSLAIAANETRVAASVVNNTYTQDKYYTAIYEAAGGAEMTRLPVNGYFGMALSPNAKWLAVGERTEIGKGPREIQLAVSIYEIASGNRLAKVVHDQFHYRHYGDSTFMPDGVQFTTDGKYLITSSTQPKTKIWEI